jgi:hypothetical protein
MRRILVVYFPSFTSTTKEGVCRLRRWHDRLVFKSLAVWGRNLNCKKENKGS